MQSFPGISHMSNFEEVCDDLELWAALPPLYRMIQSLFHHSHSIIKNDINFAKETEFAGRPFRHAKRHRCLGQNSKDDENHSWKRQGQG